MCSYIIIKEKKKERKKAERRLKTVTKPFNRLAFDIGY